MNILNHINNREPVWLEGLDFKAGYIDNFFTEEFNKKIDKCITESYKNAEFFPDGPSFNNAYFMYIDAHSELGKYFYTIDWMNFIKSFFPNRKMTDHLMVEHHNHLPQSTDGQIHHDYCWAHFDDQFLDSGVGDWGGRVKYQTNRKTYARSLSAIYYYGNEDWKEGDGGETGLYTRYTKERGPDDPLNGFNLTHSVAPINNRLVFYELCPESWHRFLKSNVNERKTVVFFFHSLADYLQNLYNEELVGWPE